MGWKGIKVVTMIQRGDVVLGYCESLPSDEFADYMDQFEKDNEDGDIKDLNFSVFSHLMASFMKAHPDKPILKEYISDGKLIIENGQRIVEKDNEIKT